MKGNKMRENTRYSPCGRCWYITRACGTLKRFSLPFSGIDFAQDVFVTSPDDLAPPCNQSMPRGFHYGNICTGQIDVKNLNGIECMGN